nr:hypothetical protein [Tanacetum cinerariifolium]
MDDFVTILTPDSARSCVMQRILPTQGTRSIISTVSISPEGFLPSILLLVVIIVTVVIVVVTVILVVVVVTIIGVVIVVMIIGMPPKRTSTSAAPAMTQASIPQLVADSVGRY